MNAIAAIRIHAVAALAALMLSSACIAGAVGPAGDGNVVKIAAAAVAWQA
ncbi:MAG: hypothetical protein ACFBQW_08880 [Sphingomonadaceae bacterium]